MTKKLCLLPLGLALSLSAHARYDSCAYLSIVMTNNGPETCYLTNANIKYGRLSRSSSIPTEIPPGASTPPFEMRQTFFSPDLALTYQCGQEQQITVESTQNYCLFSSGRIHGYAYNSYRMGAEYTKDEGSVWGRHGEITWYLHS